jgi:DNA-directed RNA polymerase specialized sigma24 family protein
VTTTAEINKAIDAVWRMESPKLIAGLTRVVRDISMAEELAADALVVAMKAWAESGVPRNPGAWLMQTAKRRAIDYFRHNKMAARKLEEVGRDLEEEEQMVPDFDSGAALTERPVSIPSSRSSTSSSTRAMPRPPARAGCGANSATPRSASSARSLR